MMGSVKIWKGLLPAPKHLKPAAILFFCLQMFSCHAQSKKTPDTVMQTYHVARIIETTGADYTEVTFLESARFYRILKSNKHYNTNIALLKEAEKNKTALLVSFTQLHGDVIEKVERVASPKKE
jgi:hypothetical protein